MHRVPFDANLASLHLHCRDLAETVKTHSTIAQHSEISRAHTEVPDAKHGSRIHAASHLFRRVVLLLPLAIDSDDGVQERVRRYWMPDVEIVHPARG